MNACECQHEHTHQETTEHSQCRYVPSFWERASEDDDFETVTLKDIATYCDDCGELLDFSAGD